MSLNLKAKIKNYSYEDFDLDNLREIKQRKGLKVAIALPVYNEEETLGGLIDDIRVKCEGLFDKIAVFDSSSTDNSEEICIKRGVDFIKDKNFASEIGLSCDKWKSGKGFNLWASVYYFRDYDIICWIDADLKLEPRFIFGILGPLIKEENILFTKGRYYRPETDNRVTRILAEPVMSMFFPETRDFTDPLCGLFGGKIDFLKGIPFYTGYSVESATLIYALNHTSPENIAQVYLGSLKNREQDNKNLGRMSASIAYTLLRIAEDKGVLTLNGISSEIVQQVTNNGIEFDFVKTDINDYKLPPIAEVERAINEGGRNPEIIVHG